ncbi:MAG: type II secretion system protein [Chlamydiales bacterium]|nr:type II secretion system protein [Chlamydiales bacterium]
MRRKKRPVTLIEIMIVILLIGLIGGALAFNMRGSMDKGKVFKTEQNISRVYDALMFEYAKGDLKLPEIVEQRERILRECPFVKDGVKLLRDAWGNPLSITIDASGDDLIVDSTRLNRRDSHE